MPNEAESARLAVELARIFKNLSPGDQAKVLAYAKSLTEAHKH